MKVDTSDLALKALSLIEQHNYDAIVSDIKMPGMDGLALLAKIKELRPETPTMLITGHGEHNLAIQALRGGAYDFIQKPIDRDYFVAALLRAVQTCQLGARRRAAASWKSTRVRSNRRCRNAPANWWRPMRPKMNPEHRLARTQNATLKPKRDDAVAAPQARTSRFQ